MRLLFTQLVAGTSPAQYPNVVIDSNLNRGTKLLRTFLMQLEALNRHRSKGEQKMVVEHVHVHSGGQAIVGPVTGNRAGQKSSDEHQL